MKHLLLLFFLATTVFATNPLIRPHVFRHQQHASSLKLFDHLDISKNRNGNLAFSPLSAVVAMQMARLGTDEKSKTSVEIINVLSPDLPTGLRRDEILVANAAFCHEATTINPEFIASLKEHFNVSAKSLDFTQPEPARATINAWVAEQTRDKIRDLLSPGSLSRDSRLVLVNALYFNDDWAVPFQPHKTRARAFNTASGATREIPFMHQTGRFNHAEVDNVQILELPYKNRCVMSLYLPRGNDLSPAFALLDKNLSDDLKPTRVSVALPKFKIEWQGSLKSALQALGIRDAFTPDADFSRITTGEKLFISDVFQAVFITVDERGTEAAAATGAGFSTTGVEITPTVEFIADRPFLFTLATPEQNLLFTGVFRE